MDELRLRVNAPQVIHEMIDGEVIIINLASGNYYSVKGCGADVWDVIQQSSGAASAEIVAALATRFDSSASEIEAHVLRFLDELRDESLIVGADEAGEPASAFPVAATNGQPQQQDFEPPVLEKYTDMQDLVLLDPVHEVDATGWPQPRPDASITASSA
jgi:coenzyme PQQ synthesis protein D (PqqD)